ncbi:MAG: substrate-binding domain-containing protein [Deltaproteobacteria bacterium]|nr:substrate-binding domain-containing protein [Deltaproteobacteria bacterium]
MSADNQGMGRRAFLTSAATAALAAALPAGPARAGKFSQDSLQVWSCGGLAEAFLPANAAFQQETGVRINYTGAFAAALGKSLLGSAHTEVFGGRVLELAKKLRQAGKMIYFKPLCFTSYVLVTPMGNPAGISSVADLARPGVRLLLAPGASPPGGAAVNVLLKKAGVAKEAQANLVQAGSCVQRTMAELVDGQGDASVVELRVTRLPAFQGRCEVIPIPDKFFPPPPLTFTVGVMQDVGDRALADYFVEWITSPAGQAHFEKAGFIPAISERGRELTEKLGVKDA